MLFGVDIWLSIFALKFGPTFTKQSLKTLQISEIVTKLLFLSKSFDMLYCYLIFLSSSSFITAHCFFIFCLRAISCKQWRR